MRKWIAHRGLVNSEYGENTKEAIWYALSLKEISGVEFDIRKTKDNQLVLQHHPMINFNSNGNGLVRHMTLKELKQYQFGTKKHPSKISTLKDTLKKIKGNKMILIEIKEIDIFELLYQTIQKYLHLSLMICSFHYEFVIKFKKKYPHLKVGLIMGKYINRNLDISHLDFVLIHYQGLSSFRKPIFKFVWTVNQKEQVKKIPEEIPIISDCAMMLGGIST